MKDYYLNKNPDEVASYLKFVEEHQKEIWPTRGRGLATLSGFFTAIFIDNPDRVKEWMNAQKYSGDLLEALQRAEFLYAPNKNWPRVLEQAVKQKNHNHALLVYKITDAAGLDMMWAAFVASGNVEYVGKILLVLEDNYFGLMTRFDPERVQATQIAARWSILSNMEQHKLVNDYVVEQSKKPTPVGEVAKKLLELK